MIAISSLDQTPVVLSPIERDLSVSCRDRRLADRRLPDRGLANRHLADRGRLIDGLWAREVGGTGSNHHGKRCTHYDHNFLHHTSPLSRKNKQRPAACLPQTGRELQRSNTSTVRQMRHVPVSTLSVRQI